ncbi:MAG: site-specific DNA-methyltransferase [Phycisphaerales bacterium]
METPAAVSISAAPVHSGPVRLAQGDCLGLLRDEPAQSVDLVYLDPPFNTGRVMTARGGAFDDRFTSIAEYLAFLEPRLEACRDVLRDSGSILVHCDWRTSHRVRCLLDDLFGPEQFVNHLVWAYGLGGSSPRTFARKHDDILFYARSPSYYFEPPLVPATSRRMAGMLKKATDVLQIPSINNLAHERTGYPTQKPLALLKLLVGACCPPGGTVLDPCCGSGTTLVAARLSGRSAIGFDLNPQALRIAAERCAEIGDEASRRAAV